MKQIIVIVIVIGIITNSEIFADDFSYNLGKGYLYENFNIDNPKTQLEKGAESREVICKNKLYLIYKTSDGSPACVNEFFSAPKLVNRGWGTLGKTSLTITTDKEKYTLGENVTITMKNSGETVLTFLSRPNFHILDESKNYIELPLDTIELSTDRIVTFDTLASTTLVWNQTNRNLEMVKPGTYSIFTKYMYPKIGENASQFKYEQIETTKTFTIMPSNNSTE